MLYVFLVLFANQTYYMALNFMKILCIGLKIRKFI